MRVYLWRRMIVQKEMELMDPMALMDPLTTQAEIAVGSSNPSKLLRNRTLDSHNLKNREEGGRQDRLGQLLVFLVILPVPRGIITSTFPMMTVHPDRNQELLMESVEATALSPQREKM